VHPCIHWFWIFGLQLLFLSFLKYPDFLLILITGENQTTQNADSWSFQQRQ